MWDEGVGGLGGDMGLEGSLYREGNVGHISWRAGDYRNEFLKRGGARAIRWSIIRNASGRHNSIRAPVVMPCPFRFSESTEQQRAPSPGRNLAGIHILTSVGKIISNTWPLPFWAILCETGPGAERLPLCPRHPLRTPLPRALWPLDVLNSYYPFTNPPLPLLQGLSRELFHLPPQIRPRLRRR